MRKTILVIALLSLMFASSKSLAQAQQHSIRFYGTGSNDVDRIKISLLDAAPPVNIGNGDFTIEWWMKALVSENTTTTCAQTNDSWINGNVMIDRDVYGEGDFGDYGISLMNGRIAFGVHNGSNGTTACGTVNVANGVWNHIAVTRRLSDGRMQIYVNGALDQQRIGPTGNIAYNTSRSTPWPNSDPYLVLGAEKHDAGSQYPSYSGFLDELRISNTLRYQASFSPPKSPFSNDTQTVLLFHFDEGGGTTVIDSSSSKTNGVRRVGGVNSGPSYSSDTQWQTTLPSPTPTPTPTPTPSLSPTPSATSTNCLADINQDGVVDLSDYSVLAAT